jgi:polysaccharide export outer membrane protein
MKKLITIFVLTVYSSLCFLTSASLALPYILTPGDILEVQILNRKDLNTKQEIGPNGKISLPFMDRVSVAGMSLSEFEIYAKTELAKYIDKPDVIVYLTPRSIHVVQHFLKTDTIVNKTATTIDEARSYVGEGYTKEIHYGDVIYVDVGTEPTWWDNNWVAVIAALAVVVGIGVNLR